MNETSVTHSAVENQQSIHDDPFELGPHVFKGAANTMSHEANLDDFVQRLVSLNGKYCFDHFELTLDMLADSEQDELVRLYIESIDREIEWACYGTDETINSDFLCDLLAMLKRNTVESRLKFAETTRRNLLAYYKNTLEDLLVMGCGIYFNGEMTEAGYRSSYDDDNGEVVWGKF